MNREVDWLIASDVFYDPTVFENVIQMIAKFIQTYPRVNVLVAYENRKSVKFILLSFLVVEKARKSSPDRDNVPHFHDN